MVIRRDDSQWPREQTLTIVTSTAWKASVGLQYVTLVLSHKENPCAFGNTGSSDCRGSPIIVASTREIIYFPLSICCLFVSKIKLKLPNRIPQYLFGVCVLGQGRICTILVQIQIRGRLLFPPPTFQHCEIGFLPSFSCWFLENNSLILMKKMCAIWCRSQKIFISGIWMWFPQHRRAFVEVYALWVPWTQVSLLWMSRNDTPW